ncbi:MAG: flagellar basal-body MS-ring/collar protein FliF [Bryobacteraceae bacterium]
MKRLLDSLTLRQKVTTVAAAALVAAALFSFSHWDKERDFRPLFTNLSAEDAGAIVTRLRESGVDYRLGDNGTSILVPSAKVAETRLQLASAGLPKTGRIGYELFDKTNFGATDFVEQVNYHRALEGELERSVMSLAEVEQARVHVTFPKDSVFLDSRQPAKASVLVKLRPGARLSAQNILAICNLAASAVQGLAPESVSVLDSEGNLLNRPRSPSSPDGSGPDDAALEYRQKLEHAVLAKINSTLEPLLGADKYRAAVSIDCDLSSGEQSEETFDPTKSVMVSSQRTEDSNGGGTSAGIPGTTSNLPRPTSRPVAGSSGTSRKTENIAYQSSRVVRHLRLPEGTVKRMSVSVLVDHTIHYATVGAGKNAKTQRIVEPPSPEKLKVVKDLVAGVAGIVPDRDQLVVESFPFESTLSPETFPSSPVATPTLNPYPWAPAWLQNAMRQKNFSILLGIAFAVLTVLLGVFVFLVRRSSKTRIVAHATPAIGAGKGQEGAGGVPALGNGDESLEHQIEARLAEQAAEKARQTAEVLGAMKLATVATKKTEVLTKQIAAEAKKDPQSMAHVVRSWLNGED